MEFVHHDDRHAEIVELSPDLHPDFARLANRQLDPGEAVIKFDAERRHVAGRRRRQPHDRDARPVVVNEGLEVGIVEAVETCDLTDPRWGPQDEGVGFRAILAGVDEVLEQVCSEREDVVLNMDCLDPGLPLSTLARRLRF